jgi:uncharacterized protein (TIGR02186 family)
MTRADGRCVGIALLLVLPVLATAPARAERLVASLSRHVVQINSSFNGVELVLFGSIEGEGASDPQRETYDIVATATGPTESVVTRRKARMFGIWVNAESRTFANVPSYLSVLSNRPLDTIADPGTLRREQIGIAYAAFPRGGDTVGDEPFRDALLRIKSEHGLYSEGDNAVTFLTPTLYRASILLPAEAQTGTYEVAVKLFADGSLIARTNSAFELDTVGFERFIAFSAFDHGVLYGLATVLMAVVTGWLASIIFRRD